MKKVFSVLISSFIWSTILANKVFAQEEFGINDLADAGLVLGTRSIQETIAGIVNIFLGFLGILATLLLLYGGYIWMTSRGNAEKVQKAKLLIASAVIGLVIILSAYAISRFILSRLYEEAGPTGPGGGPGPGPGNLPTCDEPFNPEDPLICSLSRGSGPVGSGLTIRGWHFDTDSDNNPGVGRVEIGGVVAEVVECAGSTMWNDSRVKVRIPDSLAPGNYEVILYNDVLPAGLTSLENPHFDFTVLPGTSNVNIDCLVPDQEAAGNLPVNVQILGNGFTDVSDNVSMNGWVAGAEAPIDLVINSWSDLEINVEVPANALSSDVIVTVGPDSDQEFFKVSCANDPQCSSGCCSNNACVDIQICEGTNIPGTSAPVIQSISPEDGEEGSLVTIFGYNFGNDPGAVTFEGVAGDLPSVLSGGVCIDVWTNDYIVMGVPAGANGVLNVVVTQAAGSGGESSDPYSGFERNNTVRPGLCSLNTNEGQYGDVLNLTGLNFAGTDEAYFDTVASYDTNILSTNNATAEVPNVVGNIGVSLQTVANVSSNMLPFSALSIGGDRPIINELSPDNGPVESYVTIIGSNFGDNVGLVLFDRDNDPNNGNEIPGTFDFPDVCGDYWFDDYIIVKVPAGPWVIGNDYPIRVKRNPDGALSNDWDFTITDTLPGPQICSVSPDNGPVGNLVTISGENFGDNVGEVLFHNGVMATNIANWSANQVFGVEIPVGAVTGPLLVRDSDNNDSNGVVFGVGACSNNLQCGADLCCPGENGNYCAASCEVVLNACEYTWEVNTQADPFELHYNYSCASGLQSPSPWPDQHEGIGADGFMAPQPSLDAFIDSNISALFTRNVEDADLNPANVEVWQCGNGAFFDPAECTVQIFDDNGILEIVNHNSDREGFSFNPANNLLPDNWYQVRLGTFHAAVGSDSWTPDPVNDAWHFKTRDSDIMCEVSTVAVTPQSPQANMYPGREKTFTASPLADNCNICGGTYDWQWSLGPDPAPIDSYTAITGPIINMSVNQGYTKLEGGPMSTEINTVPNHVTLIAENSNYNISGESYPIILAPILRVEDNVPSCSDSCTNVAVWVDFNTTLLGPLNINDFAIYQCLDADCSGWDNTTNYTNNLDSYEVPGEGVYRVDILHDPLPANENYIVVIDQTVTNIHGYPLGIDYRWDFGVSDTNCTITGADILPDNYTANSLNNINYRGYALANAGACGMQAIQCENCSWNWSSDNLGVATIDSGGVGEMTVPATPVANGSTNINLEIDGTPLGLGSASNSTPLTVDVVGADGEFVNLGVDNYWPNCGACTNSIAEVWFNSDLQLATVNNNSVRIFDITDGAYDNSVVTVIGNRHVVLDHGLFDLGHDYRLEVTDAVLNTSNDNIVGGWQSPVVTIENDGCLADAAWVDPAVATAGASDSIAYRAVTTYDAPSCGPSPVDCETCTYDWQNNVLGNFDQTDSQFPIFSTLATVSDGDSAPMTLNVWEGPNPLPVTDGTLNIDISTNAGNPLNIIDSWPDCDGACNNSQVGVRFNTAIDETTLGGQYSITDATTGVVITNGYTLTGGDRTLIIGHQPLVLGHTYNVAINQGIENLDGNFLSAPFGFNFTVGEEDCRVSGVNVDPANTTAGASQGISYNVETLANTVACGTLPVYCASCTYSWNDVPDLGTFNNATLQNPIFTTAATVVNGDTITIEADVLDQGVLFEDNGNIDIVIGPSLNPTVDLIGFFPPDEILMCINAVPYFEFDISNGNLDRQSLIDQAVFYDQDSAIPVDFSVRFLKLNPGILTVTYEPSNPLDINNIYFFGFANLGQVRADGGGPVGNNLPQPLDNDRGNSGRFMITLDQACPIHHVDLSPSQDSFTCIDNTGCVGDMGAMAGNQHLYQSVVYDIQNNILGPAMSTYAWSSNNDSIINPESVNQANILATAGDNGLANLNVAVFLNTDPANVVSDNNVVEVNTCQNPWPNLASYPWNDNTLPDMNFSTYYCEEYGTPGETILPHIDIPNVINSPDPNVIREYITTIDYPTALNGDGSSYLGSLAYKEKDNENSWTKKLVALFTAEPAKSQANPTVDIIAFRVMSNPEHLSVIDWYNKNAPNPQGGQSMTINGYEALQVGASIYVAASNVEGGSIYTNIYIIAHNIGANNTTLQIYNQLVENFKLNININTFTANACRGQTALSCSSDFDCPNYCDNFTDTNQADCLASGSSWLPDVCDSSLLKLRRDTKRLSDLVAVNNLLLNYGQSHKACANNSLISCNNAGDCPMGGDCVPYYPALNSGTYLNGSSNTRWPSWQETFSNTLGSALPQDPINLFNGCSDPYNPDTCWDERALEFICPANSLIYMYNINGVGQSYYLGAKFEYDMQNPAPAVTFANNLNNPVTMDLDINNPYCDAIVLNPPGASASPYCGNGVIDTDYCTEPIYDNQADCLAAGADWIVSEECDNEFWKFACSQSPSTANPPIPTVGNHKWWREQTIGCNPPGAINTGTGELIECTWYRPNPPIVASQCGGYCGDGVRQPYYESCDGSLPAANYHCFEPGVDPYCGDSCQVLCDNGSNIYPAALCGDGVWSEGIEQCDPTANPTGLSGWDCTDGGSIGCSGSCERTCTIGTAYAGLCGDGQRDLPSEACDYSNYTAPLPINSSLAASYGCTMSCEMNGQFCGDGTTQYAYQELCDWNGDYTSPTPLFSDEFNQYGCREDGIYTALNGADYGACTATLDGWCGDGDIQDGVLFPDYGEECDPGSPWDGIAQNPSAPTPANSSINNQYSCDVDCVGRIGGYCGDGAANEPFEVCDGADYPTRPIPFFSGPNNTYACADNCSGGAANGGWCGDGTKNSNYYEACDWGIEGNQNSTNYPWPRGANLSNFSSEMNQYVCSSCINFGGWCGNGIVDGACTVNCVDCDQNGNNCQSSVGCTAFQCQSKGGTFFPYEQCDNGYDPAYIVNKNVDIVYIFDTSGSMSAAAAQLCQSTATVVNTLNTQHSDINYRITIFPMGDGDGTDGVGYELTATETDNIQYFFDQDRVPFQPTEAWYDQVFDALYSNCPQLVNASTGATIDPRIRYLSLFDDATNDINGPVDIRAGDTVNEFCPAYDATENWGYAMKRVIEDYNWLDGYHRIVVPVSDEYAVCGSTGGLRPNENFVDADGIYDILAEAVRAAKLDPSNPVFINPVLLGGGNMTTIGRAIADATGGQFTSNTAGWEVQTLQVINSTICDGVGGGQNGNDPDGHMDCVLDDTWQATEPPPNPPCRVEGQSCSFIPCCAGPGLFCNASQVCEAPATPPPMITSVLTASGAPGQPFTYTITATNNPTSYGASNLPVGLSINTATGVISGITNVLGTRLVTITAINGTGTDTETLNLTIAAVPVITSPLTTTGTAAQPFTYTITATNGPISFNAEPLPPGLTINTATGVISGVTNTTGVYNVTISASNNVGSDSETLVITILAPIPVITSQLTATVPVNQAFTYTITASANPTSFNAVGLPPGLTINTNTGVISGTPTVAGTYNITISATNGSGTGSATLVLTVTLAPPVITSANTATATLTRYFAYLITATNSPTSFNAVSLPPGLTINTNTGVISGTPTATGVYNVTISATNAAGTGTRVLTITVNNCSNFGQACGAQLCCSGLSCSAGVCSNISQDAQQDSTF